VGDWHYRLRAIRLFSGEMFTVDIAPSHEPCTGIAGIAFSEATCALHLSLAGRHELRSTMVHQGVLSPSVARVARRIPHSGRIYGVGCGPSDAVYVADKARGVLVVADPSNADQEARCFLTEEAGGEVPLQPSSLSWVSAESLQVSMPCVDWPASNPRGFELRRTKSRTMADLMERMVHHRLLGSGDVSDVAEPLDVHEIDECGADLD